MSVLVDTSGWYALAVPSDPDHAAAIAWLRQNAEPLVTTDHIIDETLTLLRSRGENHRAVQFGTSLLESEDVRVHYIDQAQFTRAWEVFRDFSDKL